jgi:branched-chain amino acid transport system permease protein
MLRQREHGILLGLLVLLAAVPALGDSYYTGLASRVMIYGLAALGLDVVVGFGGMISFGHAAYFGLGAYTVAVLARAGVNEALIAWPAAVLVASLASAVIGGLSLRTRGASFIMITLAFAQMIFFVVSGLPVLGSSDGLGLAGRNTLAGFSLGGANGFHYAVLLILAGVTVWTAFLAQTPFGRAVNGIRQNETRMRALGYDPLGYQLICFTYGSAVAGLAGALVANQMLFVSPDHLHWITSGTFLVIIILGGLRARYGPLLGAAVLILLEEFLAELTAHWMLILGPLLIAIILLGGNGIAGLLARKPRGGTSYERAS